MNKRSINNIVGENSSDILNEPVYGIKIGVYVDKSGRGIPSHFIDREAHKRFVENIMVTFPYSQNYNK